MRYRSCGHVIGISLTTITHSIIFPFTELNSSRPRLVAAACQDLKKINSAETIRGNTVIGERDALRSVQIKNRDIYSIRLSYYTGQRDI